MVLHTHCFATLPNRYEIILIALCSPPAIHYGGVEKPRPELDNPFRGVPPKAGEMLILQLLYGLNFGKIIFLLVHSTLVHYPSQKKYPG